MKIIILIGLMLIAFPTYAGAVNWENICLDTDVQYCQNVGLFAYNNSTNPPPLKDLKLGRIIGVSWRPKGSVICIKEAIPEVNLSEEVQTAPKDAHYYIIDDGSGKFFLRECREIDAKNS